MKLLNLFDSLGEGLGPGGCDEPVHTDVVGIVWNVAQHLVIEHQGVYRRQWPGARERSIVKPFAPSEPVPVLIDSGGGGEDEVHARDRRGWEALTHGFRKPVRMRALGTRNVHGPVEQTVVSGEGEENRQARRRRFAKEPARRRFGLRREVAGDASGPCVHDEPRELFGHARVKRLAFRFASILASGFAARTKRALLRCHRVALPVVASCRKHPPSVRSR